MKLGIISDCIHYVTPDGQVGTENHVLLRQFQALGSFYSQTLICCPFGDYDSSKVISTYTTANISFTAVPVVGGDTLKAKFKILRTGLQWCKAYRAIDRFSEIVYLRFPNNINIPSFFYFLLKGKKVFSTYTGTWNKYKGEPVTYRLQRSLLKNYFKGPVWAYLQDGKKNKNILPGFSPSYNAAEWDEETVQVYHRIKRIEKEGLPVFRLITVGKLIDYKNQVGIIKSCSLLKKKDFPFTLTIVGDGPMREEIEALINQLDLQQQVTLAGKKDYEALRELYRQHDFVVQAPTSEGFGKVPVEGFFHGLIPVINNIAMANQITGNEERGFLFDASNELNLAKKLISIKEKIELLPGMIIEGRQFAKKQTLELWAQEYYKTATDYFAKK